MFGVSDLGSTAPTTAPPITFAMALVNVPSEANEERGGIIIISQGQFLSLKHHIVKGLPRAR